MVGHFQNIETTFYNVKLIQFNRRIEILILLLKKKKIVILDSFAYFNNNYKICFIQQNKLEKNVNNQIIK